MARAAGCSPLQVSVPGRATSGSCRRGAGAVPLRPGFIIEHVKLIRVDGVAERRDLPLMKVAADAAGFVSAFGMGFLQAQGAGCGAGLDKREQRGAGSCLQGATEDSARKHTALVDSSRRGQCHEKLGGGRGRRLASAAVS